MIINNYLKIHIIHLQVKCYEIGYFHFKPKNKLEKGGFGYANKISIKLKLR
jgi:hypothetical protein